MAAGASEVRTVIYLSDTVAVTWPSDVAAEITMLEGKICSTISVDPHYLLGKMLYTEIVSSFGESTAVAMPFLLSGGKYTHCKACDCVLHVPVSALAVVTT